MRKEASSMEVESNEKDCEEELIRAICDDL